MVKLWRKTKIMRMYDNVLNFLKVVETITSARTNINRFGGSVSFTTAFHTGGQAVRHADRSCSKLLWEGDPWWAEFTYIYLRIRTICKCIYIYLCLCLLYIKHLHIYIYIVFFLLQLWIRYSFSVHMYYILTLLCYNSKSPSFFPKFVVHHEPRS